MEYRTLDPATEELVETFATLDRAGLDRALARAVEAFAGWSRRSFDARAAVLRAAADRLEAEAPRHAAVMALEMGKPLPEGEAEARKCAWVCRYYAEHAAAFLADDPRESDGDAAFVRHDPLGPVLAIMPWNYPYWQFFRFAAPALMAGNTVLLKHAPSTPRCAVAIERLLLDAGLPDGVVRSAFLDEAGAAAAIADPRLRGVTLTGSTRAGSEVAAVAGRHLKRVVLELGGSDPFVVLDDADLEDAVAVGVRARCQNSGQSCIAAKRFVVHRAVHDRFVEAFVERVRALRVGDPREDGVDVGPLARRDLREHLAAQVEASVAAGARVLVGGRAPERKGFFYLPTVLVDVPESSPAAREELFGPVAAILRFEDDDDAVRLANATRYGLGASLWTRDAGRAAALVRRIEAGAVFVNGLVKSDPRLPFGGVKDSGFGRELGREGILEFVNVRAVWVRRAASE